ncbi:MAG: sigma-70 family RNA polymerase sigma factor [Acidobacteria bacterium]|nr:sigma-70 family RNA polymerase sigma factor [Acidobacteriota bacterium]
MEELEGALRRAISGDREALAALYSAFSGPLLSFLTTQVRRREDAEDLLGQVFMEAVRDLPRFQGDLGGFRGWLFRIAVNRAVDLARRQARRPERPLEGMELRPGPDDPEAEALARVERARVRAAVEMLPPDQRRVIGLRLAADLSSAEIAGILGKTPGAVKALQFRALSNLARILGAPERRRGAGAPRDPSAAYPDRRRGRFFR